MIRTSISEQNLPGLSVAVGIGKEIVWSEGIGWADIATRMRVTPDTRFRIGTASTTLTSAAAGILVENGRLKLDDEIQTYVPQFPKKQGTVTLRQLMAHTAGVGTDVGESRVHSCGSAASSPLKHSRTSQMPAAIRAGVAVQTFEIRLDPRERGFTFRTGSAGR